jgi:hypothetical protein
MSKWLWFVIATQSPGRKLPGQHISHNNQRFRTGNAATRCRHPLSVMMITGLCSNWQFKCVMLITTEQAIPHSSPRCIDFSSLIASWLFPPPVSQEWQVTSIPVNKVMRNKERLFPAQTTCPPCVTACSGTTAPAKMSANTGLSFKNCPPCGSAKHPRAHICSSCLPWLSWPSLLQAAEPSNFQIRYRLMTLPGLSFQFVSGHHCPYSPPHMHSLFKTL